MSTSKAKAHKLRAGTQVETAIQDSSLMNTYAKSKGERSGRSMDSDRDEKPTYHRRRAKGNKIVFSSIGEALNVVVTKKNDTSNVFSDLLSSKSQVNNAPAGRQIPEKL